MLRVVWFGVLSALLYLCFRFAVWHLALQMALIVGLVAWVVCGGILLAYQGKARKRVAGAPATGIPPIMQHRTRESFVAKFGEDAAKFWEQSGQMPWQKAPGPQEVAK